MSPDDDARATMTFAAYVLSRLRPPGRATAYAALAVLACANVAYAVTTRPTRARRGRARGDDRRRGAAVGAVGTGTDDDDDGGDGDAVTTRTTVTTVDARARPFTWSTIGGGVAARTSRERGGGRDEDG